MAFLCLLGCCNACFPGHNGSPVLVTVNLTEKLVSICATVTNTNVCEACHILTTLTIATLGSIRYRY